MKTFRKLSRTLTFRLTLYFSFFLGVSLSLLALFFYWTSIGLLVRETDAALTAEINSLAEQYNERGLDRLANVIRFRIKQEENRKTDMVYALANRSGRVVVGNLADWPKFVLDSNGRTEFGHQYQGKLTKTRARVFRLQAGATLLVGRNIEQIEKLRTTFARSIYGAILLTVMLAIVSAVFLGRKMFARIESFTSVTKAIMEGKLDKRVGVTGSLDEFDVLAAHLNSMLDRLENLVSGVRHVSDNIAHDMRTPLTRLRNKIESVARLSEGKIKSDLEECVAEADHILKMFSSLLRIARIESGSYGGTFEPVDLSVVATDAIELYQGTAEEKDVVIVGEIDSIVACHGDRNLLFQLMANLIDNAVKYTQVGSSVSVVIKKQNEEIFIIVADDGPGVKEEDYQRMLDRFVRLDPSRSLSGSGLGLSLVKAVVELHNGAIAFSDNNPGLRVQIAFPPSTLR